MGTAHASFGRTSPPSGRAIGAADGIRLLESGRAPKNGLLAYGNGRSYGDSCQNQDGTVIDMRSMKRIVSFNAETGLMVAEAGTLLSDIIVHAAPYGYFPPVVPGTQFVTLGGAIANDVHGKNHHRRGTFGCHVEEIVLLRSDGKTHVCSPVANTRLFWATIGGMGLTGIILSAALRLMRVPSLDVAETVIPFDSLDGYFDLQAEADSREYAVAWIDQLAAGRHLGRGLMLTGDHADYGARQAKAARSRLSVIFQPPFNVLNRPFLKAFNAAYRWKQGRSGGKRTTGYQSFFFPLDSVSNWNRLYGPRGLFQHQSVVPEAAARESLPQMLEAARAAGQGSFLTVLKRFGNVRSPGLISFPRPGYTLTLDFPNRGEKTLALLKELDAIAIGAGGAVNPYKDARMSAQTFGASFPEWHRLELMRDPAFMSSFWARTARRLVSAERVTMRAAE